MWLCRVDFAWLVHWAPLRRGHQPGSKEALEGKNCAGGSLCCGHSRRNPKHTGMKFMHSFLRQITLSLVIILTLIPFTWLPWWLKNLPAMQETQVQSLGWEDPPEKGMAIHSSFLSGEFHGQKSLAGYMGLQRIGQDWATNSNSCEMRNLTKIVALGIKSFNWDKKWKVCNSVTDRIPGRQKSPECLNINF